MSPKRFAGMLSCVMLTAAPSVGVAQVHQVAFDWQASQRRGTVAVDTCVAASTDRVLVATNQKLMLLTRTGQVKDDKDVLDPATGGASSSFPFQPGGGGLLFDPRVEYDAVNDRLWILYPENKPDAPRLHIAVSKQGVTPEDFSSTYWHFYTGSGTNPAFDLKHASIPSGLEFEGFPDHPRDERG